MDSILSGLLFFFLVAIVVHFIFSFRATRNLRFFEFVMKESSCVFLEFSEDDFICRSVSPAITETLGFPVSNYKGHVLREMVHPDDFPMLQEALNKAHQAPHKKGSFSKAGQFGHLMFRMRHSSLSWCWVEADGFFTVRDKMHVVVCFLKRVDDVVRLRGELSEMERREKTLLQNTFDIVWQLDVLSRQFTVLTDVSYAQTGLDDRKAGIIPTTDTIFPEEEVIMSRDIVNRRVQALLESGKFTDDPEDNVVRLRNRDGTLVWCRSRSTMQKDEFGNFMLVGVARRINANDLCIGKNSETDSLFSSIISFPNLRAFWLNADQMFIGCNTAFSKDVGFADSTEVKGKSEEELFPNNSGWGSFRKELDEVFEKKLTVTRKLISIKNSFGISQMAICNFTPILSKDGSLDKLLGVYESVSLEMAEKCLAFYKLK